MNKLYGRTLDTAVEAAKVAEQFMPPSRPTRLTQAVANLKALHAEALPLAQAMRGEQTKRLRTAIREGREAATLQLGIIRELAREVVADSLVGNSSSGTINPLAGIEVLFQATDQNSHINAFIANAAVVIAAVKSNWTHFAAAGCPQDVPTRLESAFKSLTAARDEQHDTKGKRKDAAKEFHIKLKAMRKQIRIIAAVLKAHYGPDHKAMELFREAKFLYANRKAKVKEVQIAA
jgi:hypothetical protein